MMNCDEFKASVLAEPAKESDDLTAHADSCPDCTRLLDKVMTLERRLSTALSIPVPESVTEASLQDVMVSDDEAVASNVVALPTRRRSSAPVWLAAAACMALVAVFVMRQPQAPAAVDGQALASAVVEHIEHELYAMRPASTPVSDANLLSVLSPAGSTLDADAPLVSYAKSCVIDGKLVPHLVMQGANGPVTVLLMPETRVDGPVSIMQGGVEGVILPVGDSGSIAIIGRDAASVESVRDAALDAIEFSI
ncbi:MAG: DUF3379 family protein [Woeseiaceae bacterium]